MKQGLFISILWLLANAGIAQTSSTSNTLGTTGITSINSTTNAAYKLAVGGAVKLFGTGSNVVGSPTFYLTNTTTTTGRNYFLNSENTGLFQIMDATSTPTARFVIDGSGNVGIGTTLPSNNLHIIGSIGAHNSNTATENSVIINGGNTATAGSVNVNRLRYGGSDANSTYFTIQGPNNIDYFTINNGNVGIGTIDPKGYKLAVNGSAIFTQAVVKLYANWPDYVFDPQYKLPTITSLETFIKINKHLPEIPSAEEIEKNGIDLGNTQTLLLKKTEELTLYIIDQNKRLEEQSALITEQGKLLIQLQNQLLELKSGNKK